MFKAQVALAVLSAGLDISLDQYGAREGPDGLEQTSAGLRRALADLSAAGGGWLTVPPGTWHVQPVNLTSHMVLWLAKGATLVADTSMARLPVIPALPSWGPPLDEATVRREGVLKAQADLRDALPRYQPLLWGNKVQNVTITGENGTLDGNGLDWWTRWLREPLLGRPHVIQFQESQDILIRNLTIRNPGFWTVHLWRCEFVTVQLLSILVPWAPAVRPTNTDGVNPDSSRHVLIEDSYLQTGDDAIAVKSGWDCFGREVGVAAENIIIRRVTVRQTRGCNAAAFTVGSEMSGGVQDVSIEDCHVLNAGVAVEIKVGSARGGFVRRIAVKNLEVRQTARGALVVMAAYPENNPFCRGKSQPAPVVSNISFEEIVVHGPTQGALVNFQGTPEVFMRNLTVRRLNAAQGTWRCNDRISGTAEDCRPNPCWKLRSERQAPRPGPRSALRDVRSAPGAKEVSLAFEGSWRNDGRCGALFPASDGLPARCPTARDFNAESWSEERKDAAPFLRNAPCCSLTGWCGLGLHHCDCAGCIDFRKVHGARRDRREPPSGAIRRQPGAVQVQAVEEIPEAQKVTSEKKPSENSFAQWFDSLMYLVCFVCILLVRRYIPGASKHWFCRTPHICVGTLVLVTFVQCGMSVWRYSHPAYVAQDQKVQTMQAYPQQDTFPQQDPVEAVQVEADGEDVVPSTSVGACSEVRSPMDFGAKGDGHQDDSEFVREAIWHGIRCNTTVLIGPWRRSFLVMPNVLEVTAENLVILFEGQLVGPTLEAWNPQQDTWPKGSCAYAEADCHKSGGQSPEFARSQWSLLFFRNCHNVTLLGARGPHGHLEGGLRAHGPSFWRVRNQRPQVRGYCLLKMDSCEGMRISDLHFHDSPMYQVVVARSHGVELEGLRITLSNQALGDQGAHNTDGINILNSSQVWLRQSVIESGDDNVVVKEGSSDIYGEGLQLRRGKGVSIGSLGERESEGQEVTNVAFHNVSADRSVHGVRIKTWKGARGLVQNASFQHFKTADVMIGILIDQTYCPPSQRPEGCAMEDPAAAIRIQQVRFRDFTGTYQQADRKVLCTACSDVSYEQIDLRPAAPRGLQHGNRFR